MGIMNDKIKFLEEEIKWLTAENKKLCGRLQQFAIRIGEERERARKYWRQTIK